MCAKCFLTRKTVILNYFNRACFVISDSLISFHCWFSLRLSRLCCNLKPNIKKKIKHIYIREETLYTLVPCTFRFAFSISWIEKHWDECELYQDQPSTPWLNYSKFCDKNRRMKDFSCSALYKPQVLLKNVNSSIKRC